MLFVRASFTKIILIQRLRALGQSLSCHRKEHSQWGVCCTTKNILNKNVHDLGNGCEDLLGKNQNDHAG